MCRRLRTFENEYHYVVDAQRNGKRLLGKYCKLLFL